MVLKNWACFMHIGHLSYSKPQPTEHWLFEEQLGKLEHLTNDYNGLGVASQSNPDILSGQRAHERGDGMLWKTSRTSLASKLQIDSDRLVGAKSVLDSHEPMFILAVYFLSSSHSPDEFRETLDLLWANRGEKPAIGQFLRGSLP